ncbi:ABC-type multidrug/protein/lipid transport system, ATPase component [Carnobacterium sp. AT7]|uniref:ABC transporter ATP-binding protein n=1 Tax=Carnobacterium sp. AT7 TaxID=333990 RepID=UPI00015F1DE9|nr:ABC transporter ATP-binding protein [Carnobacterium sp. AT7]EDP67676.1 ABC-type multidrug/protein/lipid transport system, ATPase component [Carnobacterium sp. AT7]
MKNKPITRPAVSPLKIFKRILSYATKQYKLRIIIVVVSIIISAATNAIGISFTKTLIDDYIAPLLTQQTPDYSDLARIIGWMALLYLTGAVFTYIFNRTMVTVSQGILKDIRDEMFTHMESLPIRYFDSNATGDIMSHYTNDTDTLRQMISQSIPQIFSSLIMILSIIIAMFIINIPMTLFVLCMVGIMVAVIRTIGSKSGLYFSIQQKALGTLNGYVEEMIEGQKVVKVFNHEEEAIADFSELNEELRENATKANTYANILMPIMANIGNFMYLLTAVIGAILSITGLTALTVGSVASFVQFTKSITMPVAQISQQFNAVILSLAGAERIFNLLDEKPEEDEGTIELVNVTKQADGTIEEASQRTGSWAWKQTTAAQEAIYKELTGDVRFKDVTFGYNTNKTILHNINLFAKPGQKIAFVGATGAGKTTITNLINRFYDIQEGAITYDGIDVKKIKKDDLRRSLGIVLQDTHLFTGTIKDNIRYGRLDASDEEVEAAAKLVNADFFIRQLPHGYDTELTGDGGSLSQGQRQLLAIARAAVANPPVLILDEATSSIDTRTESVVQSGMDALMKGRTVFVIAHRLSTVRNSDAIMVMKQGRIIERGSHDELITQKGEYYQLYTGAFEMN